MPFENCIARTYSASSVSQHVPAESGVYGLSNARGWVFIGESADVRTSLLKHLESGRGAPAGPSATGFFFELWPEGHRSERRARLIQELGPRYKDRLGEPVDGGRR